MIVYDLSCPQGHRFEGWFGSSDDFAHQQDAGLVSCPQCGDPHVAKAPMAPAVGRKGNQAPAAAPQAPSLADGLDEGRSPMMRGPMPPAVAEALARLAEAKRRALEKSRWVGDAFAEQSRAMHYGERDSEIIHGQATLDEARALFEEGIPVAPLPFPVLPPEELN